MSSMRTLSRWFVFLAMVSVWATSPALAQQTFFDDFERPDGPVDEWTAYEGGVWQIVGGELSTLNDTATENAIWAGDPPLRVGGDIEVAATVRFGAPRPADPAAVGRHAGLILFASQPTYRYDTLQSGYTVDWIDRQDAANNDYGFRIIRIDAGVQTQLIVGTPEIPEVPESWGVEVVGDTITVVADGAVVFSVEDGTYRTGHVGWWVYQLIQEYPIHLLVDDMEITYQRAACFTASATSGTAPLTVDFDASCTGTDGVDSFEWDFGDGEVAAGATVSHDFLFGGSYMVTLTASFTQGGSSSTSQTIEVFDSTARFSDDFSRADGPVDNWTVWSGDWQIVNEQLTTGPSSAENWAWAGDPAFVFPANFTLTFTYEFLATPADAVGRHGGVMFCATEPTHRYSTTIDGYTIDWIDRVGDHGIRLIRITNGAQTVLDIGAATVPEPPFDWEIVVEGEEIRVYGDGVEYLSAPDTTYRNGFFGAWCWSNGQSVAIDDVDVSSPEVNPCLTLGPWKALPVGDEFTFDAGCSSASGTPIESYEWDFGDGTTGSGPVVTHAYATAGVRTVVLSIETEGTLKGTTERTVEAFVPIESFADDFNRADGPVDGWTVGSGNWAILDNVLDIVPPAAEAYIWAGSPVERFAGITTIEFDMTFLEAAPADTALVGRHAGVFFFAKGAQPRGAGGNGNSGYLIDWIDRTGDHGYRLSAYDNGTQRALGTFQDDLDPGTAWRIEIDGDFIRLFVDGVLKVEVEDSTYRWGETALWTYSGVVANGVQNLTQFDNFSINSDEPPVGPVFHRGDPNDDGQSNITDGIFILNYLFLGGPTPPCLESANPNDDADLNITDGIYILNYLFLGGPAPAAPGPIESPCGPDPVDSPTNLGCESYTNC